MSLVNVFVNSRRAAMLTDSSLYRADGTIIAFECKAFPVASWNGALSGRGDYAGLNVSLDLAERYASFDEFIARSGAEIEKWHTAAAAEARAAGRHGQGIIEISAIGWSEREDRARAYILQSPRPDLTRPPFVWCSLDVEDAGSDGDGTHYHDLSQLEHWRLRRQGADPGSSFTAETFNPIRHGVPLAEAQRRGRADAKHGAGGAGKHVVGGELWLTVVDRDGTRQDVIHDWQDTVGEPIQPAPFDDEKWPKQLPFKMPTDWTFERFMRAVKGGAIDAETFSLDRARLAAIEAGAPPMPVSTAGMNRQQKRAAKAQAKKGRAHAA